MNAESSRNSTAVWWILALLALALLYVGTWPLIEIKCGSPVPPHSPGAPFFFDRTPPWARWVYLPLHRLRDSGDPFNPEPSNLARRYWDWWDWWDGVLR